MPLTTSRKSPALGVLPGAAFQVSSKSLSAGTLSPFSADHAVLVAILLDVDVVEGGLHVAEREAGLEIDRERNRVDLGVLARIENGRLDLLAIFHRIVGQARSLRRC